MARLRIWLCLLVTGTALALSLASGREGRSPVTEPETAPAVSPALLTEAEVSAPEAVGIRDYDPALDRCAEEEETTAPGGWLGTGDLYNATGFSPNIRALLEAGPALAPAAEGIQVLIYHTHGTEAYTPEGDYGYEETDPFRTTDRARSVMAVGEAVAAVLEEQGINVIHDTDFYDYPLYRGAYSRSLAGAEAILAEHPEIRVLLDLHRDAVGDGSGGFGTVTDLAGAESAQIMIYCGTGEAGLTHPDWEKNLAFALAVQGEMNRRWPGLTRPITLSPQRFNQHLSPGALLVEIGYSGNTLPQALRAGRCFALALAAVLRRYG